MLLREVSKVRSFSIDRRPSRRCREFKEKKREKKKKKRKDKEKKMKATISFAMLLLVGTAQADDRFGSPPADTDDAPTASCFRFEPGATCLSVNADTGSPSVDGVAAVTCSITQDGCALTFACDEGAGTAEGTISGTILTLTNGGGVTAAIAADGALTFSTGILCSPPPTPKVGGVENSIDADRDGPTNEGNGNDRNEPNSSSPALPTSTTAKPAAVGNALTTCSLPGSDSLPCGGPCEDGVCNAGDCLVLPAEPGSLCTAAGGSVGVCTASSASVGLVCEMPPPVTSCEGQADTTPCAVSNQCEKGLCFGSICLSTPQTGVQCTAAGGLLGLCTADSEAAGAPVCVVDPTVTPAPPVVTTTARATEALEEPDAPYTTQCTEATSGKTCLSGPCTLGLCAQSYCVPLAFVEDATPCGNGAGVCFSGQCAPATPSDPGATVPPTTTAAPFDDNALSSVPSYDSPGAIRIQGTIALSGVSLPQVQTVSILQRAITFTLQLVAHDSLLPDPAVDLVTVSAAPSIDICI